MGHKHRHEHHREHGRGSLYGPVISGLLLLSGITMHYAGVPLFSEESEGSFRRLSLVWYLAAFFPVAWPVMREAWESLCQKDIFNEFILMLLASAGAFCIGEYPEAVAVMLFYTIGERLQDRAVERSKCSIRTLFGTEDGVVKREAPTEIFLRRVCRVYTPMVMGLSVLVFLGSLGLFWFSGRAVDFHQALYRALVFLVIACPCALVVGIPLCYFAGVGKCSQNGILFKGGNGLDAAVEIDAVVFDKTGTLTMGERDELKPEATEALARLKKAGITDFYVMSCDTRERTDAVAKTLGIENSIGGMQPEDKVLLLRKLTEEGRKVAFVGDGVNDSPGLACAHLGVAMGKGGSDAAIATSDVVLPTDNLLSLPLAVELSRGTRHTVWENIVMVFAIKILIMVLGLFDVASLWLAVFADSGVALLAVLNTVRFMRKRNAFHA